MTPLCGSVGGQLSEEDLRASLEVKSPFRKSARLRWFSRALRRGALNGPHRPRLARDHIGPGAPLVIQSSTVLICAAVRHGRGLPLVVEQLSGIRGIC